MKTIQFVLFNVAVLFGLTGMAQIVYTDPALPYADESVILYFNTEGTPLEGYSGDVYAHTGITVNGNQWQNVIGDWGNNTTQPQLTRIETDLYQLDIVPTIREFYNALPSDNISEMCFVFRSSDGSTQTSPDIFVTVYEPGLNVTITSPNTNPYFVDQYEGIFIEASASGTNVMMSLFVDNEFLGSVVGNYISNNYPVLDDPDTKHWIKVIATNSTGEVADSVYYYVRGETVVEEMPSGVVDGINYIDNQTVTLVLHAPYKSSVYVFGDFNNWEVGPEYKLKRNQGDPQNFNTRYWVTFSGLTPGEEYAFQYLIDEELVVADPYTDKVLDPLNDPWIEEETYPNLKPYPEGKTTGLVSILQTGQPGYQWQHPNFDVPATETLVVYELLMRDFTDAHDFNTMKDTVNYFKRLGVTAIELMPVNEFEGNLSWGYNPSFYFAPDKYYGPKDDLKAFIDICHANGIAVILDMVLNHAYGQCVLAQMYWDGQNNRPAANNPWFNTVSPNPDYAWGSDFNHESPATKAFIDRVNRYWMSEYKVDGFRFDFTKGFTNTPGNGWDYDAARIAILKRMADSIWVYNPDAYVILEHFTDNNEETVLANYGMDIWGNMNFNYNEATMGWNSNSDFSWISWLLRGYDEPHLTGYMESHDEERLMAKNLNYGNSASGYNITDTTIALQRMELAGAFFLTIPGPKMLWQFCELGYDYHINYPGAIGGNDHRLDPKPIRWDYALDERRDQLFTVYSYLNLLRKTQEAFGTDDFSLSVDGAMKKVHLNHTSMNVTILGNFDVNTGSINPSFQHTGWWYDYFAEDSIYVSSTNQQIALDAGGYKLFTDVFLGEPGLGVGINDQTVASSKMKPIYPNPSSGNFKMNFHLVENATVNLNIYDLYGRLIYQVCSDELSYGNHSLMWNGDKENGDAAPGGIYFVVLSVDGSTEVHKIVLQ